MPSMKKFPEFELSKKLVETFSEQIGPTRMNRTSSETRAKMMALATEMAVRIGQLLVSEEKKQLSPPDEASGD